MDRRLKAGLQPASFFFSKHQFQGNVFVAMRSCLLSANSTLFWLAIISFGMTLGGCKDPDELGLDTLPASDQLSAIFCDTLTLYTHTVKEDSIRSDEVSVQLLGSISDPVFGEHQASIYTQTILEGIPDFGTVTQADSLILTLAYKGFYGDTNIQQTVHVYRMINEDMHTDSNYYTNRTFAYDPTEIGSLVYYPFPATPVVVDSDTVSAQLRIPLSLILADSIMQLSGHTELSSNDNWKQYFKGLHLTVDAAPAGQGCISYFDFFNSGLVLYYHDTSNTIKRYTFSLTGARVNSFTHTFSAGTDVAMQLADSNAVDSLSYLQAMGSVKTKITFPNLKHFTDSGSIVINKAEFEIHVQSGTPLQYPIPSELLLLAIDSTGASGLPIDYYESAGYYGGTLHSDGVTYRFNMARQIQRILDGHTGNYGFYLVISGASVQANRLIVGSGKNSGYRMKLNIYYTKLH